MSITEKSLELFLAYARDSENWSGTPLVGGNVGGSKEERGNLTQLKRAGLITTFESDGGTWIGFTGEGRALAKKYGYENIGDLSMQFQIYIRGHLCDVTYSVQDDATVGIPTYIDIEDIKLAQADETPVENDYRWENALLNTLDASEDHDLIDAAGADYDARAAAIYARVILIYGEWE